MPILTWDKVLKIILTILNILSSCLSAFGVKPESSDIDSEIEGHS